MDKDDQEDAISFRCGGAVPGQDVAMERSFCSNWDQSITADHNSPWSCTTTRYGSSPTTRSSTCPKLLQDQFNHVVHQFNKPWRMVDEAGSDPSSSTLKSSTSSSEKAEIDDDTLLADLMEDVQENKVFTEGVERERTEAEKHGGAEVPEEDQSPSKAMRESRRKLPKTSESSGSRPTETSGDGAQAAGKKNVRMVVEGQLEDEDLYLDFPEKPPELDHDQLFEVDSKAADTELLRLIELGVLKSTKDVTLEDHTVLQTKLVYDWRWRNDQWTRRARLVAQDFNWMDPNRSDCFAPAGGQSLLRLIPAIAQLRTWKLVTLDVKDAYLMCDEPRKVKITLERALAEKLKLPQEWILGKVLPGQREGAAEWFQNLRSTLKAVKLVQCMEAPTVWTNSDRTMAILVHVDDMVVTGTDDTVKELIQCLHGQYKIAVEEGDQLTFLKRSIEVTEKEIHIKVNNKYLEGLVNLLGGVRKKKTPGEQIVDETSLTSEKDIEVYRSCVGTLLYISGDRPDVQFYVKELAGKLQCPTKGAMKTLENVVGYLAGTMDFHVKMTNKNPAQSFRCRAKGVTTAPFYEEDPTCWLLETDSDWSGNKLSRSSTSCGCVFLGGIWIYSYSKTQRNITLSSTESEFVALVSGACEGLLLRAVLQHLVGENVQLKLYGDNTSCMAIAAKEGVCKVKHLSGRLLWIQQRQGRDFQL